MKNFFAYLKLLLIDQFRFKTGGNKGMLAAVIILAVCFIPVLILLFIGMLSVGGLIADLGIMTEAVTLLITIGQIVVIVFGLIIMLNTLYFSKDSEFALPLPMRPMTVYAAKLTSVYIFELITSFIITFAILLPLGIGANVSAGYYFTLIIAFVFIPMLPLLLASLIAIPLMYIVNFFKNKGILSTLAFIILFVVLFGGYYLIVMQFSMTTGDTTDLGELIAQLIQQIKVAATYIFPNFWLASLMTAASVGSFLLFLLGEVLVCVALLALTVLISNLVYNTSISRSLELPKSNNKAKGTFSNSSQFWAVISKDVKQILRFPSLGFYCLTQVVMAPMLIIIMSISLGGTLAGELEGFNEIFTLYSDGVILVLIMVLMFFVVSLNYTATSSLSRESDSYYVLKVIPCDFKKVIEAKVVLAIIVNTISVALSIIAIVIMLPVGIIPLLVSFAIVTVYGAAFSYLQVYIDVSKPNVTWKNIANGIKNSPSILYSMLIAVVFMLILGFGGFSLYGLAQQNSLTMLMPLLFSGLTLIGLVAMFLLRKLLLNNCEKLLARLEV